MTDFYFYFLVLSEIPAQNNLDHKMTRRFSRFWKLLIIYPYVLFIGVRQVPEGSGEQGKLEKTECKIICGAQRPSRLRD